LADGEGKDVYDVLMGMNAQLSRVEAKVDGLVSHERMAEIVNASRREWRDDIRTSLAEARHERQNDIQKSVSEAEARLRAEIRSSNTEQDRRNEAREELIEKTAKSVRLQFIGIMGMALTGLAYALYQIAFRGG
jgi:hypothetical protein